jgi:hypothetical protein
MSLLTGRESGYEFLDDFDLVEVSPHTSAPWLLSEFAENVWVIQTNQKKPIELDWGARLWDDSFLTDAKNEILLRSLKHLLIISANGVNEEFATLGPASQNMRVACASRLIDYLLINAQSYDLIQFGLGALNADDLKGILNQLASHTHSEDSIYAWHERASAYCKQLLSSLSDAEAEKIFTEHPSMLEVSDDILEGQGLDINASDIPKIRAAMMKANLYYGNSHHGYKVSTKALSERLYPDTIRGRQNAKSALMELSFYPNEKSYRREYPGVKVTTGESEILQFSLYFYYRYTLINSAALSTLGLPAPADADTETIKDYMPALNDSSRFRSVPSANLLKLFRRSMEFHVEHGRKILNGFIRVASHCHAHGIPMTQLPDAEFKKVIGPELVRFGVQKLGLSSHRRTRYRTRRKGDREQYFRRMRANHGLLELVYVYLGSIQLTVGMIMARRVDELVTLETQKCLDSTKSWLIFKLAKSTRNALGIRQRESRPIDAIAVEMIEELRRFQKLLRRLGVTHDQVDLFATPPSMGHKVLQDCSLHLYNRHLDFACDYFESDVTEGGERYYVRQHQLRRFFAIMFFYTNSFGELDTLRWMFGHRDIEHIWRYLTECMEPKEIRGAGARYFADLAKKDRLENYKNLRDLLSAQFGTTSFALVDERKIETYLAAMLEEGKARFEPQFFKDENGTSMKILFIVS